MSLLTVARYRAITGDTDTTDAAVTARVELAVERLAEVLDRPLVEGEYTETLTPSGDGRVWPRATPITDPGDYTLDGLSLGWVASGVFGSSSVAVTYTGGFVERSGNPTALNRLPVCIEEDLAWAVWAMSNPPLVGSVVPAGARSVQLGDVSVTFGENGASLNRSGVTWSRRTLSYRYTVPRGA